MKLNRTLLSAALAAVVISTSHALTLVETRPFAIEFDDIPIPTSSTVNRSAYVTFSGFNPTEFEITAVNLSINYTISGSGFVFNRAGTVPTTFTLVGSNTVGIRTPSVVASSGADTLIRDFSLPGAGSQSFSWPTRAITGNVGNVPSGDLAQYYAPSPLEVRSSFSMTQLGSETLLGGLFNVSITGLATQIVTYEAVPEPATLAVVGLGVASLIRRKRRLS